MDNEAWPENDDSYDDGEQFRFEFESNLKEFNHE